MTPEKIKESAKWVFTAYLLIFLSFFSVAKGYNILGILASVGGVVCSIKGRSKLLK